MQAALQESAKLGSCTGGGWRQRDELDERERDRNERISRVMQGLIAEGGEGILSAPRFWQHCHNEVLDGNLNPCFANLAGKIRNKEDGNIHRFIIGLFRDLVGMHSLIS